MKVSILTYHWEDNYGATMQAYATYRAVKESGHTPEFIDLRLPYAPSLKSRLVFGLKRYRFNSFRKKHFRNLTDKTYRSVEELRRNPPASDCYLVGSDQTWNPQIGKKLLPAFFLTFGDDSVRRVTYATSIGLNQWEKSPYISDSEIKKSLGRFHRILLREDSGIRIARETFGVEARQVVDPVLLFHSYPELTGKIRPSGEVITYKLINDEGFYDKARAVADTMHLPVRSIGSVRKTKGYRASYPESVEGWIRRIAGASLVLTDSFHGTVISLLYHRPFVVYIGSPNRITRIVSLLDQLGLSERILTGENTIGKILDTANKKIDWNAVDKKLSSLRADSLKLLEETLSWA